MTATASSSSSSTGILAALDQLVAVVGALGLPVTRDPGDVQPPCALVGPPTITGLRTMAGLGLTVPVYLIADTAGQVGLDWMLDAAELVRAALGEDSAEPTIYSSPINPAGLPAYLVSVRLTVTEG